MLGTFTEIATCLLIIQLENISEVKRLKVSKKRSIFFAGYVTDGF